MSTRSINLSDVRLDGGTQCRAAIDQEHIATLADAWQDGAKIPAVVVFHDGSNYWLADGFHRYHAAQKCEFKDIEVEVHSGTRCDAVRYALGANAAHGLSRSPADKRKAVDICLREFSKMSDVEASRVCAVSQNTVREVRAALEAASQIEKVTTRTGADGKSYPATKPARKEPTYTPPARVEIVSGKCDDQDDAAMETPANVVPYVIPPQRSVAERQAAARSAAPVSWADEYASMAIDQLRKISKSDPKRGEAFARVAAWINENQ